MLENKALTLVVAILLGMSESLAAQNSTTRIPIGDKGAVIINKGEGDTGTFAIQDVRGGVTHSGIWRGRSGYITWLSQRGQPQIQGYSRQVEGSWRVYWKATNNAFHGNVILGADGRITTEIKRGPQPKKQAAGKNAPIVKRRARKRVLHPLFSAHTKKSDKKTVARVPVKKTRGNRSKNSPIFGPQPKVKSKPVVAGLDDVILVKKR